MGTIDIIVLILYVVGMLAIGFISKGKINSMDDFILGGKRFNKFALTGTILATMVGSGMMMEDAEVLFKTVHGEHFCGFIWDSA